MCSYQYGDIDEEIKEVPVPGEHLSQQRLGDATGQAYCLSLHSLESTEEKKERLHRKIKARWECVCIWGMRKRGEREDEEKEG